MDEKKATGTLKLKFEKQRSKTCLTAQYYKLPLQVLPPYYQDKDGTAFIYLLNPSGGVLQGDRLYTTLHLGTGAQVVATTPASGKFYKMEEKDAVITNTFTLGDSAVLEYIPEHSVPFAGSNVQQHNTFHLKETATLFAVDAVTSGRKARGESFQYKRFCSRTSIFIEDQICLYDCMDIRPEEEVLHAIGMLQGMDIIAAIYIYCKGKASKIKAQMEKDLLPPEELRIGMTAITDDLLIVRILGNSILEIKETIMEIWGIVRLTLFQKTAVRIRKY